MRIIFGAHWTLHRQADLDATLLLFDAKGRYLEAVNFMTPSSSDGSITHMGDNVTGICAGDDEAIKVHLDAVPERVWAMVMLISCFKGSMQIVKNMSVRCAEITTMASRHGGYEMRELELAQFPVQVDEDYWEHHKHMHRVNHAITGQTAMCMCISALAGYC